MLIPIGHDKTTVRRLPWVTFTVMILCLVVFLATRPGELRSQRSAGTNIEGAVEYFVNHPYLELQPRFLEILELQVGEDLLQSELELMRQSGPRPPDDGMELKTEQDHLDALVSGFFEALDSRPSRVYGYVASDPRPFSLLSYQFMHAGWLHLIFNLVFLFVVGPFIEDVWGRPLYAVFYLTAGIVSALMFGVRYPDLDTPLIGASGAVAGAMGAFLVRFVKAKMRFILWIGIPLGPFRAPAWVIFPFWFLFQLFSAQIMDLALPESGGGGVAFWAHVWGFAFGVVVAAAIVQFRVEEGFIQRNIESKITLVDNTPVEEAAQLAEKGQDEAAIGLLESHLESNPENLDAAMSLWNVCFERGQSERAIPHIMRALESAIRGGDHGFVIAVWEEVMYSGRNLTVNSGLALRAADILRGEGRHEAARDSIELGFRSIAGSTPAALLLRLARMGIELGVPGTPEVAAVALAHPDLPPDAREELESIALDASSSPDAGADEASPVSTVAVEEKASDENAVEHKVEVMQAIPRRLAGQSLELEVNGVGRMLDLATVQVLAACGVSRAGQKPVVVVDLILDSPWGNRPGLRTVRMTSDTFDPRRLVEGEAALEAFQVFLQRVLEASEAVPLPDPDAAIGRPFKSFPSIDAYQREILGVG
jgi:membrane associated rhomboid family serine protease